MGKSASAIRLILLFAALMALWLLMSGYYTPLVTGLGVASAAFAMLMARRIGAHDSESLPLHMMARVPGYVFWLFGQIILSNIATIRLILGDAGGLTQSLFRTGYSQRSEAGIATYANSITLTPGTVTVEIDDDTFLVHALTEDMARDVKSGEMDRRVTAVEGGAAPVAPAAPRSGAVVGKGKAA